MAHIRVSGIRVCLVIAVLAAAVCSGQSNPQKSITVVLKDGQQKSFALQDISRIDFKNDMMTVNHHGQQENIPVANIARMDFTGGAASKGLSLDRNYFAGKWQFGESPGMGTFDVTLDPDGQAHKTIGDPHGTWTVIDSEAQITWADGWRDVIRKVGDKHQKFAYEPGRPLTGDPSNVTRAKRMNEQ